MPARIFLNTHEGDGERRAIRECSYVTCRSGDTTECSRQNKSHIHKMEHFALWVRKNEIYADKLK